MTTKLKLYRVTTIPFDEWMVENILATGKREAKKAFAMHKGLKSTYLLEARLIT